MNQKNIGSWGEKIAQNYLKNKNYLILETNWRHHHKEMDIIAYRQVVVGLEIKTRNTLGPVFTVLSTKQVARLRSVLKVYCHQHQLDYQKARLDLITIELKNQNTVRLRHYLDI